MKTFQTSFIVITVSFIVITGLFLASCEKEEEQSERFKFLTGATWLSDSLLVNGTDASGPGQPLELFKGEAVFRTDGTGNFGVYAGKWRFEKNETELVITSDTLAFPLATKIEELTATSLKVTTNFPNPVAPASPLLVRLTFKAK